MSDKKITDLTAITTPATGDVFVLVDISDTTASAEGTNKRITFGNLTSSFATLTGTETLANKTFTAPVIDQIENSDGEIVQKYESAIGTNVNYLTVTNSVAGNPVSVKAEGSDSNIELIFRSKGTSGFKVTDDADAEIFTGSKVASAVNHLDLLNAATGNPPTLKAVGGDTNIDLTLVAKGAGVVTADGVEVVTISGTQTLTNKRINKRVGTTASSATPTPNADTTDIYTITALAAAAEFGAPTGTPVNGQGLIIRIKDDGTARALTYNAIYRAIGVSLPSTTVISKTMYLGFIYNSADTKWDVLAVGEEA